MEVKNFLWIQNSGSSDVSLSDLGVKVLAGKTINIYKANPYLTVEKVEQSKKLGSLFRRLITKTLKIVAGPVSENLNVTRQLKASKNSVMAKKTKSSVIVEPNMPNEEGEKFEFADYGVNDIVAVKDDKSVVMSVKQDEPVEVKTETQIQKVREETVKNSTDSIGPIADMASPKDSMAVVVKPTKQDPTPKPEAKKTQAGSVVVGEEVDKPRSLKAIAEGKQDSGLVLEDDAAGADKVIKFAQEEDLKTITKGEEGMRIATKNEEGVVVVEVKEKSEKKVRKPKSSK